ncbi:MAG: hypothetical protein WAU31_04060 [Candidatus Moraniibacteriota bacterium]
MVFLLFLQRIFLVGILVLTKTHTYTILIHSFMKLPNKHVLFGVISAILLAAIVGAWCVFRNQKTTQLESGSSAQSIQSEGNSGEMQASDVIDTSNWKTYRNEKYGFEFKLSDEYSVPENLKNQVKTEGNIVYIDPQKASYIFNSREGLKISDPSLGGGDAMDSWVINLTIFDYSEEFESDFGSWVEKNHDADVEKIGTDKAPSNIWQSINFVSWASICSDYSAFFTNKKSIIEVNTCGTNFFYDGNPDYFSSILNTFQYFQ